MSTPPFLALPEGASATVLGTARGPRAALVAEPAGPGPARGTALLVPGFTGSKEDFIAVLAPLRADGWRVVALDQRGQFESPAGDHAIGAAAPGTEADSVLAMLAADLAAAADALGDGPLHLVGHSLGGLVARAAVLAGPGPWASLTLLCSGPAAVPEHQRPGLQALVAALPAMPLTQVWDVREALEREAGAALPPPEVHAFLRRRFVANDPVLLRAKALVLLEEPDRVDGLAAALAAAARPAAVVTGDGDDVWSPAEQRLMAERLGVAQHVIPGAGHSPAVDQPGATAAALAAVWAAASPA